MSTSAFDCDVREFGYWGETNMMKRLGGERERIEGREGMYSDTIVLLFKLINEKGFNSQTTELNFN